MSQHRIDDSSIGELRLAQGAFLAFVFLLPIQPTVFSVAHLAVFPGDLALAISMVTFGVAVFRRRAALSPSVLGLAACLYLAAALPSVALSEVPAYLAAKWSAAVAYVLMALLAAGVTRSEAFVRKVVRAWLLGTAITAALAPAAVALFCATHACLRGGADFGRRIVASGALPSSGRALQPHQDPAAKTAGPVDEKRRNPRATRPGVSPRIG